MLLSAALGFLLAIPQQVSPPQTIIVSWDGAANQVVKRLIAEHKLPNLQEFVLHGATADHMLPAFPSKTAVSHMSLFSGSTPDVNGVVGNAVPLMPRSEHTLLETRTGFSALNHKTSPLWVVAAQQGLRVSTLSAAGSYPPAPDVERLKASQTSLERYIEYSGFEASMVPEKVYSEPSGTLTLGSQTVRYEAQKSANGRYEYVKFTGVDCEGNAFSGLAKPYPARTTGSIRDNWVGPFKCQTTLKGMAWFRVWDLDPVTGKMNLFQRKVSGLQGTEGPEATSAYMAAYDGFHDDSVSTYAKGGFGKPMYQGGTGEAEERLYETIALDCEFSIRGIHFAIQNLSPNLLFHYSPVVDSLGHHLMGLLDKTSPTYDAKLAAKMWPVYERAYILLDRWIGQIRKELGPSGNVILVSDHGMQGVGFEFNINAALERVGLLGLRDGKIDLPTTSIMAPPWADNMLVVNSIDWKGGIVEPAGRADVLLKAKKALLEVRDPKGKPVVKAVYSSSTAPRVNPGMASWTDLVIDLNPGYYPSAKATNELFSPIGNPASIGGGTHGFDRTRPSMHAIFFAVGPSFKAGTKIPEICAEDVMPTLGKALGLTMPKEVNGKLRNEILSAK